MQGRDSIPTPGEIPHASGQLSPSPQPLGLHFRAVFLNRRSHHSEEPASTARGQPLLPAARESPHAATNAQHSPKWIRSKKKNISVHEVLGRNWTCKQNTRCSGWQRSREESCGSPIPPQHTSAPLRSFQVAQGAHEAPWGWLTPSFHSWGHQGPRKGKGLIRVTRLCNWGGLSLQTLWLCIRVPLRLSADPTNHSQICFLADGWRATGNPLKDTLLSPHSNHGGLPGGGGVGGRGEVFGEDFMPYWRRNLRGKVKLVNLRSSVGKARYQGKTPEGV